MESTVKLVTNILLALWSVLVVVFLFNIWSPDSMQNLMSIMAAAVFIGAGKIVQVFLVMIARGFDSVPKLLKK